MEEKEIKPERIKIKVSTSKGERVLEYMRVEVDFENENSCYMAFCQEIENKDILDLNSGEYVDMNFYVPVMGTLGEFLREIL